MLSIEQRTGVESYNSWEYDGHGKLEKVNYPDASTVNFTYDLTDNLETMVDSIGTTEYFYDTAYRLTSMTNPYGSVVSYDKYDAAGNLEEMTYPGPGSKKVIYTYDELNRIKTVTIDWLIPAQTATYFYDAAGRLDYVQNFNGTTTDYDYDNANRLIALNNNKSDASIIATYSFPVLDGNGNREQVLQDEPLASSLSAESVSFQYNNAKNRLEWAGATSFGYNNEGQLIQRDGAPYTTFDYEHRLVSSSDGITAVQYVYDGKGNRLQATRNGVVTRYVYDAAGNLIAEANGSNNITRYYIYGAGLLAMIDTSDSVYTYHFNANGNTVAITDASQTLVNKYAYTSFGRLSNEQETFSQPFKFVGQHGVMTEPNGFYYMKARYYDPEVGRFISEDPIGFEGGDLNFYAYVSNNPIMGVDPSGLIRPGFFPSESPYGQGSMNQLEGLYDWISDWDLSMDFNPALVTAGGALLGKGAVLSIVGAAEIGTFNPFGIIPLGVGLFDIGFGGITFLGGIGYDPFGLFPGMTPNHNQSSYSVGNCRIY